MNVKVARQMLSCRTPAGTDDGERQMREALAVAEGDAGLREAFAVQRAADEAGAAVLLGIELEEADGAVVAEGAVALAAAHSGAGRNVVKNPATIAVGLGFLLMVAVLVWNFMGRAGTFPEEAIRIAMDGAKMGAEKFDPVEEKASGLQDWFMMKGFENFRVPAALESLDVVGVRIFKEDNEAVAQVLIAENRTYAYVFAGAPFGIDLVPEKAWRITEADRMVYAIRQEDGICFLLMFKGKKAQMEEFLKKHGAMP
ncbi:hypothetical protein BH09VER1_BH09VER1_54290 [soil metagenome]